MRRTLVALMLVAATTLPAAALTDARADTHLPPLPACATEDGSGGPVPCIWRADQRGNHRGHDVVVTG